MTRQRIFFPLINFLIWIPIVYFGCENDPGDETLKPPEIMTSQVDEISETSAVTGGSVNSEGGVEITDKGICWSIHQKPTFEDEVISAGSGPGSFSSTIVGLQPSTRYYVRAYAAYNLGIGYGDEVAFETLDST